MTDGHYLAVLLDRDCRIASIEPWLWINLAALPERWVKTTVRAKGDDRGTRVQSCWRHASACGEDVPVPENRQCRNVRHKTWSRNREPLRAKRWIGLTIGRKPRDARTTRANIGCNDRFAIGLQGKRAERTAGL